MRKIILMFGIFLVIFQICFSDTEEKELSYDAVTNNYTRTIDSFLKVANVQNAQQIRKYILQYSSLYNINPFLIVSMIKQESRFNQNSYSPVGAIGIMQLMPDTAKELEVNPYNLEENIKGGTKYMSKLLKVHNKDIPLALASYNAGLGNVQKYNGIPPFSETQNYVKKIVNTFDFLHDLSLKHNNSNIDDEDQVDADMELYKQLAFEDKLLQTESEDEYNAKANIVWFKSQNDIDNTNGDLTYNFTTLRYFYKPLSEFETKEESQTTYPTSVSSEIAFQ